MKLYFFKRVHVSLTNAASPNLLDAVVALTNQSPLRVTFRAPFVLLYSGEDVLDTDFKVELCGHGEKTGPATCRIWRSLTAIGRGCSA